MTFDDDEVGLDAAGRVRGRIGSRDEAVDEQRPITYRYPDAISARMA